MKLKDEIVELVNQRYQELLDNFRDADCIPIDIQQLKALRDELYPLLEDIKTEVSDIQRQVHEQKKNKERKKKQNYEPDGNDPELDDLLQDLLQDLDKSDKLQRKLDNYVKRLPNGDRKWWDLDDTDVLPNFVSVWFLLKETIGKWVDSIIEGSTNKMERTLWESFINNTAESIKGQVTDAENQIMIYIDQQVATLLDELQKCCSTMTRMLSDNTNTLDHIERVINNLDPVAQGNQDLSVEARVRALQAEIAAIRGLL